MATVKPDAIERTVEKTHIWLNNIARNLGVEDRRKAYRALRAVLHVIRDRLPIVEAVAFGAQLPMLIRGLYYEGFHPHDKPVRVRHADAFADLIEEHLRAETELDLDPEQCAVAVFREIASEIDRGEVEKLLHLLPVEVRSVLRPSEQVEALG